MEVQPIKSSLEKFYAVAEAYVVGDDLATTFSSCGAVMLAAIFAGTRSPEILAEITGLPVRFIDAVLLVMESGGHHFSLECADLITVVHYHRGDLKRVEDMLHALMDNYWSRMDPIWCDAFEILRGGYLFGGRRQWWLDEEAEGSRIPEEQWVN